MTTILYTGDPADLTLAKADTITIVDQTSRAFVHGLNWDGNPARLTFDPGASTTMELLIRPAGRWPRLGRRPSVPRV